MENWAHGYRLNVTGHGSILSSIEYDIDLSSCNLTVGAMDDVMFRMFIKRDDPYILEEGDQWDELDVHYTVHWDLKLQKMIIDLADVSSQFDGQYLFLIDGSMLFNRCGTLTHSIFAKTRGG